MIKINKALLVTSLLLPAFAYSGEAEVKWQNFDEYSDVRPGSNWKKENYYNSVKRNHEKTFRKLASKLPDGYVFSVEVTDLDLAGEVLLGNGNGNSTEPRVMSSTYSPKITLNYTVKSNDGKVVSQDSNLKLKDMSYLDGIVMRYKDSYYYDNKLIAEWFEDKLLPSIESAE
jgi:hypothetical protein